MVRLCLVALLKIPESFSSVYIWRYTVNDLKQVLLIMTKRMNVDIVEERTASVVAPLAVRRTTSEYKGERALVSVMRKAKVEAVKRHTQAMATHAERMKAAISAGVALRQDLARDW